MFLWNIAVTSLAEVWIEIDDLTIIKSICLVTSLAEVWIEIKHSDKRNNTKKSLPLRKCGLKYLLHLSQRLIYIVTSLAEVWIEILFYSYLGYRVVSLPLRKCGLKSVWQIL